jgi:predicted nuclease with TOPRIM domain
MMEMEQMMERLLARMDIKQTADRKADRDELKAFQEKMDSNQKKVEADSDELKAKLDSNRDRMAKFEGKMEETIKHQMQHFLSYVDESMQNIPEAKKTAGSRNDAVRGGASEGPQVRSRSYVSQRTEEAA